MLAADWDSLKTLRPTIQTLCRELAGQKEVNRFRFTIGTLDEELCSSLEPSAPAPQEGIAALNWAHAADFSTRVSIEPVLNAVDQTTKLVELVEPYIMTQYGSDECSVCQPN